MPGCLVPRLPRAPHCQFSRSTSMPFQVGDSMCLSSSLRRLLTACWPAQALTSGLREGRPTLCVSVPLLPTLTKALQSRGYVQSQFFSHLPSDPAGPSLLLQTPLPGISSISLGAPFQSPRPFSLLSTRPRAPKAVICSAWNRPPFPRLQGRGRPLDLAAGGGAAAAYPLCK